MLFWLPPPSSPVVSLSLSVSLISTLISNGRKMLVWLPALSFVLLLFLFKFGAKRSCGCIATASSPMWPFLINSCVILIRYTASNGLSSSILVEMDAKYYHGCLASYLWSFAFSSCSFLKQPGLMAVVPLAVVIIKTLFKAAAVYFLVASPFSVVFLILLLFKTGHTFVTSNGFGSPCFHYLDSPVT